MLQEYLDQLFDAFKEGISDVEGTVVHLNRRHAEITGIPREEMLGHSVMEFVKRGRLDVVLNPEVMRTGQPATRVQTVSDGRKLILEANPVFDAQGKLVLCITFLRDVTMLSEMREQMSVQKELLEAFQQLSTAGDAQELSRKTPKLFTSSAMIKLYGEVNTIAETDATVLLLGETGVGKDVIARRIHALSLRKNKTFIKVDCGSIPENLIETELFGYAAGTFSGASKTGKIGLIEAAAGGTLFLDYKWPGNIRELENLVQGLAVTSKDSVIRASDVPISGVAKPAASARRDGLDFELDGKTYKEIMKDLENKVLSAAMERYGSITEVARHFQVDRSTIFRKVKELEKEGKMR